MSITTTISGHTLPVRDMAHAEQLGAIAETLAHDQREQWLYAGAPVCVICAGAGIAAAGQTEIIRDAVRDGLGTATVYACDACISAGTEEDREHMGITADEWAAIVKRGL